MLKIYGCLYFCSYPFGVEQRVNIWGSSLLGSEAEQSQVFIQMILGHLQRIYTEYIEPYFPEHGRNRRAGASIVTFFSLTFYQKALQHLLGSAIDLSLSVPGFRLLTLSLTCQSIPEHSIYTQVPKNLLALYHTSVYHVLDEGFIFSALASRDS